MSIVIDAHIHLYPCYRLPAALAALHANLGRLSAGGARAAIFAERSDCRFFRNMRDGRAPVAGWQLTPANDPAGEALVAASGADRVFLFPGRQLATAERLEVLALLTDADLPDRAPIEETIAAVRDAGGLPALNWAPGKWWLARGRIVRDLLQRSSPGNLLLCDTSLRPGAWREPAPMRCAARRGFAIVAGSDPLPFPAQERLLGSYGTLAEAPFDAQAPALSIRRALTGLHGGLRRGGRRRPLPDVLLGVIRNTLARREKTRN